LVPEESKDGKKSKVEAPVIPPPPVPEDSKEKKPSDPPDPKSKEVDPKTAELTPPVPPDKKEIKAPEVTPKETPKAKEPPSHEVEPPPAIGTPPQVSSPSIKVPVPNNSAIRPVANIATSVVSFDEETHPCTADDSSYEAISEKFYHTKKYARAL